MGYLLRGNLLKSIQYHPLPAYMVATALIRAVGHLTGRIKKDGFGEKQRQTQGVFAMVWIGVGILLVNWAIKNWFLVVMGIDLLP